MIQALMTRVLTTGNIYTASHVAAMGATAHLANKTYNAADKTARVKYAIGMALAAVASCALAQKSYATVDGTVKGAKAAFGKGVSAANYTGRTVNNGFGKITDLGRDLFEKMMKKNAASKTAPAA